MGLRDAEEMLEAAQADAVQFERDLARIRAERDVQIVETKRLQRAVDDVRRIADRYDDGEGGGVPSWVREIRAIVGEAPDLEHS